MVQKADMMPAATSQLGEVELWYCSDRSRLVTLRMIHAGGRRGLSDEGLSDIQLHTASSEAPRVCRPGASP